MSLFQCLVIQLMGVEGRVRMSLEWLKSHGQVGLTDISPIIFPRESKSVLPTNHGGLHMFLPETAWPVVLTAFTNKYLHNKPSRV